MKDYPLTITEYRLARTKSLDQTIHQTITTWLIKALHK